MDPAVESTPHASAMIFNSTYEGATPIAAFMDDDSMDTEARRSLAKEQTGEETPCCSTSGYCLPGNPWPKSEEVLDKNTAFAFTKRKKMAIGREEQGNSWDQYGDSSSAASASASAEESGRECTARVRSTRMHMPPNFIRCSLLRSMMYSQPTEDITLGRTGPVKSGLLNLFTEHPVPVHAMRQRWRSRLGTEMGLVSIRLELTISVVSSSQEEFSRVRV